MIGRLSPTAALSLAGSEEDIKYVFISNQANQDWDYKLLTADKQQIKQLLADVKATWSTNLRPIPKEEEKYSIIFDDDAFPDLGHNGFIDYYPESQVFSFIDQETREWSVSIGASEVLQQQFQSAIKR